MFIKRDERESMFKITESYPHLLYRLTLLKKILAKPNGEIGVSHSHTYNLNDIAPYDNRSLAPVVQVNCLIVAILQELDNTKGYEEDYDIYIQALKIEKNTKLSITSMNYRILAFPSCS